MIKPVCDRLLQIKFLIYDFPAARSIKFKI